MPSEEIKDIQFERDYKHEAKEALKEYRLIRYLMLLGKEELKLLKNQLEVGKEIGDQKFIYDLVEERILFKDIPKKVRK